MENNKEDFNLKITVRNGRLLRAIRAKYESSADMARKGNLSAQEISSLVSMRAKPIHKNGDWRELALDVAGMLSCDPEDLWPDHIKEIRLKRSSAEMNVGLDTVTQIAKNGSANTLDRKQIVGSLINVLTPREKKIIDMLYHDGKTLEAVGYELCVSRERVRQMEFNAIRKMKARALKYNYIASTPVEKNGRRHHLIDCYEMRLTDKMSDIFDE